MPIRTEHLLVFEVFSVDERENQVGFMEHGKRRPVVLDLSGATFIVGKRTLQASRGAADFVAFEEL
jgi:hypothetical protein